MSTTTETWVLDDQGTPLSWTSETFDEDGNVIASNETTFHGHDTYEGERTSTDTFDYEAHNERMREMKQDALAIVVEQTRIDMVERRARYRRNGWSEEDLDAEFGPSPAPASASGREVADR